MKNLLKPTCRHRWGDIPEVYLYSKNRLVGIDLKHIKLKYEYFDLFKGGKICYSCYKRSVIFIWKQKFEKEKNYENNKKEKKSS